MNGFERHGIDHLSASSINLWTNAPDVWVARYLLKERLPFGPAAERGKAVEKATVATLLGETFEAALAAAHDDFDRRFLLGDLDTAKERDRIKPMAEQAIAELEGYGQPEFTNGTDQEKISINANLGDWKIPVWGFLDLVFPSHGLVVDLKSTTRVPSAMSADHQLQRAIYHAAKGNQTVKFLYVSEKKAAWLEDGDPAALLAQAKDQIRRMERFCAALDAEQARNCVPVNPHSFYWRGAEAQRREIYGI